jgi:hypothetical protein
LSKRANDARKAPYELRELQREEAAAEGLANRSSHCHFQKRIPGQPIAEQRVPESEPRDCLERAGAQLVGHRTPAAGASQSELSGLTEKTKRGCEYFGLVRLDTWLAFGS